MEQTKGYWSNKTDAQIIKKLIKVTGDTEEQLNNMRTEKGWSWDVMYQVLIND